MEGMSATQPPGGNAGAVVEEIPRASLEAAREGKGTSRGLVRTRKERRGRATRIEDNQEMEEGHGFPVPDDVVPRATVAG
ncbi:hypothetical protein CDL15_Pgr014066 [Punica granatum]|uniref:Uncharacterized protein n=1 Tax=Punica granatum TaxID=22663 RepID=A0A218WA04_PUNGR|nr:hypothetical protein CDL15_Pgr014066 [Punica granatum]